MKSVRNTILAGTLFLTGATAFAGATQIGSGNFNIKCRADISAMVEKKAEMIVELNQSDTGKLSATVNGAEYNKDVIPVEYEIRKNSLAVTDFYSSEADQLNDGERRLLHIKSLNTAPELGVDANLIPLTFKLEEVVKVRAYDLLGDSPENKFGGSVLLEAYDANGALLGRIFSSMLPGQCL